MDKESLRSIIFNEMKKILQDDALYSSHEEGGILDSFDIPGEENHGRNLSYGSIKSDDREGRMTKKELYYIFRKSQSLYDMLHDDDDLPEWVQSKVTRCADKIQSVYEYLEYKIKTKAE
jgi:hypothetical protein